LEKTYHPADVGVAVWRPAPPHPTTRHLTAKFLLTILKNARIIFLEQAFGIVIMGRGFEIMTKNEEELIALIRENDKPEMVASYMLSLFLDYLRTHGPSQEKLAADPLGSI
jgi:hypothetical protein